MSGKTISNGTLSLRFMQNAQRAKMQAQVELEQAKIQDDAQWEVSGELREAWGIGTSSQREERIVHETSYLPFLFEADSAGPSSGEVSLNAARLRGRRVFNGRGQEIIQTEKIPDVDEGKPSAEDEGGPRGSRKPQTRPVSISGFKAPISIAKKDGKKVRTKTAQMLIREDPLASMPPFPRPPAAASSGFMKPAGIDEPASKGGNSATQKRGREQDPSVDPSDAQGKKRKKKKAEVS